MKAEEILEKHTIGRVPQYERVIAAMEEYGKEKRMDGYKAGSDSIHNILIPELETQRRLNAAQKAKIQELEKKLIKIKNTVNG